MVELSNISIKSLLIVLLLTVGIFSISTKLLSSNLTYAQTSPTPSSFTGIGDLKKTTSAGALDILLQISPQPIGHTDPTSFQIYTGFLFKDIIPTAQGSPLCYQTLSGSFLTPAGAGGSATRNEYGWYAQSQIPCN